MRMVANIYSNSEIVSGHDIERVYNEKTNEWWGRNDWQFFHDLGPD